MMNPFISNPLYFMMNAITQPMNPYDGNGLLHPVYITPLMMHQLEQSGPKWESQSLYNAKAENLYCHQGLTVECDGGKPEKIVCFAGCADVNPCDTNLFASYMPGDRTCDGQGFFYYTCEASEEMSVFNDRCAAHAQDEGAKIDIPKQQDPKYKLWTDKVRHNRRQGKGRDIIYHDKEVADQPGGMSVGAGRFGNIPVTDQDLGNVPDKTYKFDRPQGQWEARAEPNNMMFSNQYAVDSADRQSIGSMYNADRMNGDTIPFAEWTNSNGTNDQVLEWMVVGVWTVCLLTLTCCICCIIFVLCARQRGRQKDGFSVQNDPSIDQESFHQNSYPV